MTQRFMSDDRQGMLMPMRRRWSRMIRMSIRMTIAENALTQALGEFKDGNVVNARNVIEDAVKRLRRCKDGWE